MYKYSMQVVVHVQVFVKQVTEREHAALAVITVCLLLVSGQCTCVQTPSKSVQQLKPTDNFDPAVISRHQIT